MIVHPVEALAVTAVQAVVIPLVLEAAMIHAVPALMDAVVVVAVVVVVDAIVVATPHAMAVAIHRVTEAVREDVMVSAQVVMAVVPAVVVMARVALDATRLVMQVLTPKRRGILMSREREREQKTAVEGKI